MTGAKDNGINILPQTPTIVAAGFFSPQHFLIMLGPLVGSLFNITGGATGIGLSTVKTLLSRGASLTVCDIDEKNMRSAQVKEFLATTKRKLQHVNGVANIDGTIGKSFGLQNL